MTTSDAKLGSGSTTVEPEPQTQKEKTAQLLTNAIKNNPNFLDELINRRHVEERHVDKTPEELIQRALTSIKRNEHLFSASAFYTAPEYDHYVIRTLSDNVDDIAEWLHSDHQGKQDGKKAAGVLNTGGDINMRKGT